MISVSHLTKRYGSVTAVDDVTFTVGQGKVTGFLGPNGAGKSTTMGMMLGLDAPTAGTATIDGVAYRDLEHPLRMVGALLDPGALDPKRTSVGHLRWLAASNRIPSAWVDHVLGMVGLENVANRRAGSLSLGMRQRLGLAAALLGDPHTLILDEPFNGLDPDGILWLRGLIRNFADDGRTVFLSSHLMAEMALTADHLVVITQGRLVADVPASELIQRHTRPGAVVRALQDQSTVASILTAAGGNVIPNVDGSLTVDGLDAVTVGRIAAERGIALTQLTPSANSLEDAFLDLTRTPDLETSDT